MFVADVNECDAASLNNCNRRRATCINTPGSFTCQCDERYQGDGRTCRGTVYINSKVDDSST